MKKSIKPISLLMIFASSCAGANKAPYGSYTPNNLKYFIGMVYETETGTKIDSKGTKYSLIDSVIESHDIQYIDIAEAPKYPIEGSPDRIRISFFFKPESYTKVWNFSKNNNGKQVAIGFDNTVLGVASLNQEFVDSLSLGIYSPEPAIMNAIIEKCNPVRLDYTKVHYERVKWARAEFSKHPSSEFLAQSIISGLAFLKECHEAKSFTEKYRHIFKTIDPKLIISNCQ